jgi:hypothetical protein
MAQGLASTPSPDEPPTGVTSDFAAFPSTALSPSRSLDPTSGDWARAVLLRQKASNPSGGGTAVYSFNGSSLRTLTPSNTPLSADDEIVPPEAAGKPQRQSYVGLSVGLSRLLLPCGDGVSCVRRGNTIRLFAGTYVKPGIGVDLGYVNFGSTERDGILVRARGLNFSAVGTLPLSSTLHTYAKVGTTYSVTNTETAMPSIVQVGGVRSFGMAYGAGFSKDFAGGRVTLLGEWTRTRIKYATGPEMVDTTSISVRFNH